MKNILNSFKGVAFYIAIFSALYAALFSVTTLSAQSKKSFKIIKELPITNIKNQYRSGTCWAYATLGYFESEILRKSGKSYDLCEMFVVNKDYMDCATHYVRMHGYSQISEGGSCDDVLEVIANHGICPEDAMPLPGSLTGDSLANFKVFFPELEKLVTSIVWSNEGNELNRFTTEEWDNWTFTYDHVMLIYGKAVDESGKPYYLVKNSWGKSGNYNGIWYMSRDYIALNTTYIFLNKNGLNKKLRKAVE